MDNTQLVIKDVNLREKRVAEFTKACDKLETSLKRDTWAVAEVVHKTVSADNFKDAFTNLQDYADCINYGKSNLSKMSQSVKWARICAANNLPIDKQDFTVGQVTELLPVFKSLFVKDKDVVITDDAVNTFINFYHDNDIDPKISVKDLRAIAKKYTEALENKKEKPENEEVVPEADVPLNETCVSDSEDVDYIFFQRHVVGQEDDKFVINNPQMIVRVNDFLTQLFAEFGNDVTLVYEKEEG